MRKPRKFRPTVAETQLEERIVLSVKAAAIVSASAATPIATSAQVAATLDQIHGALVTYQSTVTNAIHYAQAQITAGKVTQAQAIPLLEGYIANKTSQLFFNVRKAAGILPYGAGFNAYVLTPTSPVGDLPSGAQSLYALLSFPSNTSFGPVGSYANNVITTVQAGNFNGTLAAVNAAALHSTYAQARTIVNAYIINGIQHKDFGYHK